MIIAHRFDSEKNAMLNSQDIARLDDDDFPKTFVVCFSPKFVDEFERTVTLRRITTAVAGVPIPVYSFSYSGKELGFYNSVAGGAAAVSLLEEMTAKGSKQFLFFGSCGSLNSTITPGHLLIPTDAYRDEGTSYHYAPAADFIPIDTAGRLAEIFDEL